MSVLEKLDISLFNYINQGLSSDFLDFLLVPIRYEKFWIPFYAFVLVFLIFNIKKYQWFSIFFIFATIGSADLVSSHIIKPMVERPRPCHENSGLDNVIVRVRCGSGYSFTSSHATNHFATATILFLIFAGRKKKWMYLLFLWAAAISIAQVYVGVHYPVDIFCGSLLGTSIGILGFYFYKYWRNNYLDKKYSV